jgi:hypothetical protein
LKIREVEPNGKARLDDVFGETGIPLTPDDLEK